MVELLAAGPMRSGQLAQQAHREFGMTHGAVSQHLKVLRDAGVVTAQAHATTREYTLNGAPLAELSAWLQRLQTAPLSQALDALDTELVRGRRQRRRGGGADASARQVG